MKPSFIASLSDRLNDRDHAVLADLERFRLLSTRHVQRLHFSDHATSQAGTRATNRTLHRLSELGTVTPLRRRVGGVRKGSASFVWQLAATGEHYLRAIRGQARRRRFPEPGMHFFAHTLAVADVAVTLVEAERTTVGLAIEHLGTEPGNWRRYLGVGGETKWLKPDLHVITSHDVGGDEVEDEHEFLEIDLGTEHLPRIQTKCQMYLAYAKTGAYQAAHGLFPAVVWLSADRARRAALRAAVGATRGLPAELFRVVSPEDYLDGLVGTTSGKPREPPDPR
jgi:hypothetical protein